MKESRRLTQNGGMFDVVIRAALHADRSSLEALQWRASLANRGDRDSLLANPDAIALPGEQIADGHVFVAEHDGLIVGFAAVLPRPDGNAELDALFVDPRSYAAVAFRRCRRCPFEVEFGVGTDVALIASCVVPVTATWTLEHVFPMDGSLEGGEASSTRIPGG